MRREHQTNNTAGTGEENESRVGLWANEEGGIANTFPLRDARINPLQFHFWA